MRTGKAVRTIREKFPPGSLLVNINSGRLFMIGVKRGRSKFWMMSYEPPKRGLEHALTIVENMELAESQVRELPARREVAA
jgi:ABC-type uncharacterized transport system ATPase component